MRDNLTARELEIYKYLLKGTDYYTIADMLNVKRTTIVTHIIHLFDKMLVNSRQELMAQRIDELEKEVEYLKRTSCDTVAENKSGDKVNIANN